MAYNLDQSYTSGQDNADGSGIGNLRRAANNNTIIGQSFTKALDGDLNRFELYIKKVGSPTGNIWMEIHADGADPSAAAQQGSDSATIDVSTVSTSYSYVAFDFTNISLTTGVEYWALLYGDYTEASDVGIYVGIDTSSPSYSGGIYGRYGNGGAAWEDVSTYDALFKQYSDDTSIAYTKSFTETVTLSEPIFQRAITKAPTEIVTMTDTIIKASTRIFTETALTITNRLFGRKQRTSPFSQESRTSGSWNRET